MEIRESLRGDMQGIADLVVSWDPDMGVRYAARRRGPLGDREFVAEARGEIVGWIAGNHSSGSWGHLAAYENQPDDWTCSYIGKIFVHPRHRSGGIGRDLISAFEEDARVAGRDLVVVFPDESKDRERVRRFYHNCGYTLMSPSRDNTGMDPWLMAKALPE